MGEAGPTFETILLHLIDGLLVAILEKFVGRGHSSKVHELPEEQVNGLFLV